MKIIDTHTHLNDVAFEKDVEKVIEKAKEKGVIKVINSADTLASFENIKKLSSLYPEFCYGTYGVHPNEVKGENDLIELEKVIKDKTILVVDDSNVVRNFVYKIFNSEYDVLIANDGKEALDIIRANVDDKIVGMLLDLNMPNVDGFQVLDYFKQANLFARIPVAIITGEGTQSNIERAYQYPIVDMLQKPFNEVNVKNIVNKLIMVRNMNMNNNQ